MMRKSKNYKLFVMLSLLLSNSCSLKLAIDKKDKNFNQDTISILRDPNFQNGIKMLGANTGKLVENSFIYPFGVPKNNDLPIWKLAEWGSKELLKNEPQLQGKDIIYANLYKSIIFSKENHDLIMKMKINAGDEMTSPRMDGQYWPHLLLEQEFLNPPYLSQINALFIKIAIGQLESELKMDRNALNPKLHTAQFQLFITIKDTNPHSKGYGDFL